MAKAVRINEVISRRKRYSKTFLRDDGKLESDICNGPVHYADTTGAFQDINLSFVEDSDKHLASEHQMTFGLRKDGLLNKTWGLRLRTAEDIKGDNCQFEMTPVEVNIDGVEQLSGTEFTSMSVVGNKVTHIIKAGVAYVHELRWSGVLGYVKADKVTSNFVIKEKLDVKGFHCTNVLKGGLPTEYKPDIRGGFNFVNSDTDEFSHAIKKPVMWDGKSDENYEKYSRGILHRLYFDGLDLIYEKTPTAEGRAWLASTVGAVSIDTSTDFSGSTSDGDISEASANYTTIREATTGNISDSGATFQTKSDFSSPNFTIHHSYLYFDITGSVGSDDVGSVNLFMVNQLSAGSADVIAQLGTQADPLISADYNNFVSLNGGSYGVGVVGAGGSTTDISFNATGIADAEAAASGAFDFKICLRNEEFDFDNTPPTVSNRVSWFSQENTTPSNRPKLTVVHEAAAGGIEILRRRMEAA